MSAGAGAARLDGLRARVLSLIERLGGGGREDAARDDAARDVLLSELLAAQRELVAPYGRLVAGLGAGSAAPLSWPALPTDVFRFARVAAHPAEQDARVFRTSGTTLRERGQSCVRDLRAYDAAALAAARHALFPDRARMRLCLLAPAASEAPDSSLGYMLERFSEWFGDGPGVHALAGSRLDTARLEHTLAAAERAGAPVALLGTSFAFVHAEDALGERRFRLPPGSRVMQTGGFKGRSRSVEPRELLERLSARYGVPPTHVVQEYGMTELGSQLYETTLREALLGEPAAAPGLWWPGWVRVTITDPETLAPLPQGEVGLVRVDDLANVDTVAAVQTSDMGRIERGRLCLLGRAASATPRGCSLAVDAVLGAER